MRWFLGALRPCQGRRRQLGGERWVSMPQISAQLDGVRPELRNTDVYASITSRLPADLLVPHTRYTLFGRPFGHRHHGSHRDSDYSYLHHGTHRGHWQDCPCRLGAWSSWGSEAFLTDLCVRTGLRTLCSCFPLEDAQQAASAEEGDARE